MTQASHSPIGASSMHRWKECPGSVQLSKNLPPKTNIYAEEGLLAHELAAHYLKHWDHDFRWEVMGLEMQEAVGIYLELVTRELINSTKCGYEEAFDLSFLYPGLRGTCDAWGFWKEFNLLRVYDYKHGKGHAVEVKQNPQLLYYALGAFASLDKDFRALVKGIELVVVQPRKPKAGSVIHRWAAPISVLKTFADELVLAAKRTEMRNAPLKQGSWCYFCPALSICPLVHAQKVSKAKDAFSDT